MKTTVLSYDNLIFKNTPEINLPASKSYTNRALLIAALAEGSSTISNCLISDDTRYMCQALKEIGVFIEKEDEATYFIQGTGGKIKSDQKTIFIGNAGTGMRFLASLLSLAEGEFILTGNSHMKKRPIKTLVDALNSLGGNIKYQAEAGYPPLIIKGQKLRGGRVSISGSKSSQFISSLLMCGPYMANDLVLEITDTLKSCPYIDITLDIMKKFGGKVSCENARELKVSNNISYQGKDYQVEGDASSASYFLAWAALNNEKIILKGIGKNTVQGDAKFIDLLSSWGCQVEKESNYIACSGKIEKKDRILNMADMPDLVLTLAVLVATIPFTTRIEGVSHLRYKETDRLKALAQELHKLGIKVEEEEDYIIIYGKDIAEFKKARIETYDDHRMAMSFAILGSVISGIEIINPDCVSKSYPNFWQDLAKLGFSYYFK